MADDGDAATEQIERDEPPGPDAAGRPSFEPGRLARMMHPLGWVVAGLLVLAVVATIGGSDFLIGNLPWWCWVGLAGVLAVCTQPMLLHRIRLGLEGVTTGTGFLARRLGWLVFGFSLFNVVTRYVARYVERDIIIGEVTSLAWMTFGVLFLLGFNYGVKAGVNPRIDFWWANFSSPKKAWLDFVMHVGFFLPFLIMGIRILWDWGRKALGMRIDGTWPDGWRVWDSWEQSSDAGQLPVGPIKFMIFVGFVLFSLQIMAEIIKNGFVLMGRDDLADLSHRDAPQRIE